jgi:hypothetical protein
MTQKEIMQLFVGYYNIDIAKYEMALTMTVNYIIETVPEEERKSIIMKLLQNFKQTTVNIFPKIVDVKIFTEKSAEDLKQEALQSWDYIWENANSYVRPIFENARIQYALQMTGGWCKFCTHDSHSTEGKFYKKDWIEAYINCNPAQVEIKALDGNFDKIIYLGDKDKINKMIEDKTQNKIEDITNKFKGKIIGN